jgi:hypothetical protein
MFHNLPFLIRHIPWFFFFLLGSYYILECFWQTFRGVQTLAWAHTQGQVLSAKIDTIESQKNKHGEEKITYQYKLLVKYQYQVDEKSYIGDRIAFFYLRSMKDTRDKAILEKLNSASSIRVFYNKHNPADSVLITGLNKVLFVNFIFGIMILTISCGLFALLASKPLDYANLIQSQTSL